MLAIDGCIDPAATNGKVIILKPRSMQSIGIEGIRSATPGQVGKDARMHRVTVGITAVPTNRVSAIARIIIRPGADGVRNLLSVAAPGSMGIVPRCAGTMIVIRPVHLLVDSMRVAGTGDMRAIRLACVKDEDKAIGAVLPPSLQKTPVPAAATGMGRAGSSRIEAQG